MKKFYFLFVFFLFLQLLSQGTSFAQVSSSVKESATLQKTQGEEQFYSGSIWGWGRNDYSQLGDGTTVGQYGLPIQIENDTTWKIISSGGYHSAGIKNDGTLWVCGTNHYGVFGTGDYVSSSVFIQNGTENKWKSVVAGTAFTLAMKYDGSLWGWGNNAWGVFADSTFTGSLSPVKSAKILWGKIKYLTVGEWNCAAITNDGSLWMWGENAWSTLGDGTDEKKCYPVKVGNTGEWLTVACSGVNTVAIKKDGSLWRWGINTDGHLSDGTLINISKPKKYGTETNWAAVSIGDRNALALKNDGTLWAWGENNYGQVGDGTTNLRDTPVQIGTDNDWYIISIGCSTSFATKKDGSLWSWGLQSSVENPTKNFLVPTRIENLKDIIQISNNVNHTTMFINGHLPKIPSVVTLPITKIKAVSAESGGYVKSNNNEDAIRGICYSTSSNPTLNNTKTIDGKGLGVFQSFMTKLEPYTKYYVRAYATNTVGTGYGQEETFVTKLSTPILINPKNKNADVPIKLTLIWKRVEKALNYRLQLSTLDKFNPYILSTTTSDTFFDFKNLQLNTRYYWRVQALCNADSSDWSDVWTFTTLKFNPQELISPVNDTINVSIPFEPKWRLNSSFSAYILQVSQNNDFSSNLVDINLPDTIYLCASLKYFKTYYWRVRAVIGEDQSDWSPIWKFTTLMDSVNLKTPADLAKNINIPTALTWEEGIYKKDYRLQISETYDFATTNADTLISKTANADINNLSYWQKYFWRVRNESGDTLGYWSQIWQFKTRLSDILLIYPENTQTGLAQEINFKWNSVFGSEYYQLQISKNDNFTDLVYSRDSIITTEHFVPDLEPDILYYWRVRVWNTETIGTAYWSEVWTFTTGGSGVKDETTVIKIIPNPAGDFITVTLSDINPMLKHRVDETSIQIYNTLGEKVMTVEHTPSSVQRINISDLPKGMYFVKAGNEMAKKFIKL